MLLFLVFRLILSGRCEKCFAFKDVDLTGVNSIEVGAWAEFSSGSNGETLLVIADDPDTGKVIGSLTFSESGEAVSGIILTPRKDHSAGRIQGANIYVSDSDNGEWFLLGDKLEFEDNDSPQEIKLSANLDIKRVRVEITSGYSGFGSLAEFDLIDKKDELKYEGCLRCFRDYIHAQTVEESSRLLAEGQGLGEHGR